MEEKTAVVTSSAADNATNSEHSPTDSTSPPLQSPAELISTNSSGSGKKLVPPPIDTATNLGMATTQPTTMVSDSPVSPPPLVSVLKRKGSIAGQPTRRVSFSEVLTHELEFDQYAQTREMMLGVNSASEDYGDVILGSQQDGGLGSGGGGSSLVPWGRTYVNSPHTNSRKGSGVDSNGYASSENGSGKSSRSNSGKGGGGGGSAKNRMEEIVSNNIMKFHEALRGDGSTAAQGPLGLDRLMERVALARTADELCIVFGTKTIGVFNGEIMLKKYVKDFLAKDSYIWIDPHSMSLHWAKQKYGKNAAKSKFILLGPEENLCHPSAFGSSASVAAAAATAATAVGIAANASSSATAGAADVAGTADGMSNSGGRGGGNHSDDSSGNCALMKSDSVASLDFGATPVEVTDDSIEEPAGEGAAGEGDREGEGEVALPSSFLSARDSIVDLKAAADAKKDIEQGALSSGDGRGAESGTEAGEETDRDSGSGVGAAVSIAPFTAVDTVRSVGSQQNSNGNGGSIISSAESSPVSPVRNGNTAAAVASLTDAAAAATTATTTDKGKELSADFASASLQDTSTEGEAGTTSIEGSSSTAVLPPKHPGSSSSGNSKSTGNGSTEPSLPPLSTRQSSVSSVDSSASSIVGAGSVEDDAAIITVNPAAPTAAAAVAAATGSAARAVASAAPAAAVSGSVKARRKARGFKRGVLKSLDLENLAIVITTTEGNTLELKLHRNGLPYDRLRDWIRVLRAFNPNLD